MTPTEIAMDSLLAMIIFGLGVWNLGLALWSWPTTPPPPGETMTKKIAQSTFM